MKTLVDFNFAQLERLIKRWIGEAIEERLTPKVIPLLEKKEEPPTKNKLVKINEASQFTGCKKKYIYNLVNQNAIPYIRIRKSLRFDLEELELWMKAGHPHIADVAVKKLKEDLQDIKRDCNG